MLYDYIKTNLNIIEGLNSLYGLYGLYGLYSDHITISILNKISWCE